MTYRLKDALRLPEYFSTYNRLKVSGIEGLCILLKRFAYPCRYYEFINRFGRPVPDYSIIFNDVMTRIYDRFEFLVSDFNVPFLSQNHLMEYCRVIKDKGAPLDRCIGFIDGTVRPICRPGRNQAIVYNGHKRVHALKYQSVALPNGLIGNMFGPPEGKRHDCALLRESGLIQNLNQYAYDNNRNPLYIYGDPAYPLLIHVQCPFQNPSTPQEEQFNKEMSRVRVSVEWLFGDISNWWAFLDFKKNLKLNLSAVGKMYKTCALLANARTCLYGNITSDFFDLKPPSLEDYFH